jgi:hypothetical protein
MAWHGMANHSFILPSVAAFPPIHDFNKTKTVLLCNSFHNVGLMFLPKLPTSNNSGDIKFWPGLRLARRSLRKKTEYRVSNSFEHSGHYQLGLITFAFLPVLSGSNSLTFFATILN